VGGPIETARLCCFVIGTPRLWARGGIGG
jgi:hypothetical protein